VIGEVGESRLELALEPKLKPEVIAGAPDSKQGDLTPERVVGTIDALT
jgi:hypothetical protein